MAGCNDVHAADRRYALQIMKRVFGYAASVDTTGLKTQESYAYLKYDIRANKRKCMQLQTLECANMWARLTTV